MKKTHKGILISCPSSWFYKVQKCIGILYILISHSSVGKESTHNVGDPGSRSPGERNGNPLQYSCLESPMDRGDWQATVQGATRVGHDLAAKPSPQSPMGGNQQFNTN